MVDELWLESLRPQRKRHYKEWSFQLSEATEILATERLICEYLSGGGSKPEEECKLITEESLRNFWKFIQDKKDGLDSEFLKD